MSKRRWMRAVVAEAKKSGEDTARSLPFARQVRPVRAPSVIEQSAAKRATA